MNKVDPQTYLIGMTTLDFEGLGKYLLDTGQSEFLEVITTARSEGISDGEIICSFYAKLCYKALTTGRNANITRTRNISDNIEGCFDSGHGSVFEHCWFNFVTTNCSRVFTHELVRHRVGTAFSQTSGRYVRSDVLDLVIGDPVLTPYISEIEKLGETIEAGYNEVMKSIDWGSMDFGKKKKLTSALRRLLPNGQANEIGWSVNIRALRHLVNMRTSRHAEWEIRKVFEEVYLIVKDKFPKVFYGAKEETVEGILEIKIK